MRPGLFEIQTRFVDMGRRARWVSAQPLLTRSGHVYLDVLQRRASFTFSYSVKTNHHTLQGNAKLFKVLQGVFSEMHCPADASRIEITGMGDLEAQIHIWFPLYLNCL